MRIDTGRVYQVSSGDEQKWRALAEYAYQVGGGTAHGIVKLRSLRDEANRAVVIGPDGEGNVCRLLIAEVSRHTDPRAVDLPGDELARLASQVLSRCDDWRALRDAARRA